MIRSSGSGRKLSRKWRGFNNSRFLMERLRKLISFRACQAALLASLVLVILVYYFDYPIVPKKPPVLNLNSSHHHYIKIENKDAKDNAFLRIVHISDTHGIHNDLLPSFIPYGDVLVHSGDFSHYSKSKNQHLVEYIRPLEEFFQRLPHKHKIYIPGNHDYSLENHSSSHVQKFLPSAIYLHDRSLVINGIHFYGTGWNRARKLSKAQAFAIPADKMHVYWDKIPTDTEILISHSPPYGILDQDVEGSFPAVMNCTPEKLCNHEHMGSMALHQAIFSRIRPTLHLFGHSHYGNGWVMHDGILFCNSALDTYRKLSVIDVYYAKNS